MLGREDARDTSLRICAGLIATASLLVPGAMRREWRCEWEAEIWHRSAHLAKWRRLTAGARARLVRECAGAFADALALRSFDLGIETALDDVRAGARMLGIAPRATAAAVFALAVGVGASAVALGLAADAWLRPMPYGEPDRLVLVENWIGAERHDAPLSRPEFLDCREQTDVFERLGAAAIAPGTIETVRGPAHVRIARVGTEFFETLDVRPEAGETPASGASGVAMSRACFDREFGADASVVGSTITLDGARVTVMGVMPSGFDFPAGVDLWIASPQEPGPDDRQARGLAVVARLRRGTSIERARDVVVELSRRSFGALVEPRNGERTHGLDLVPLQGSLVGGRGLRDAALLAVVGLVFAAATASAVARLGPFVKAERAGPRVAGGVLLALVGSAAGFAVATVALWALDRPAPHLAGCAIVLAALAAFGVTLATSRPRAKALRRWPRLAIVQIALAALLFSGGAFAFRDLAHTTGEATGFDPQSRASLRIVLPKSAYDRARRVEFVDTALDRIAALDGVSGAGAINILPLCGRTDSSIQVENLHILDLACAPAAEVRSISPGYFPAMGIPILAGRPFDARDRDGACPVAIVNEAFAKRFLLGDDPTGRRVRVLPSGKQAWLEIVGVVASARQIGPDQDPAPEIYLPYAQYPTQAVSFVARTTTTPAAVADAVHALDPHQPVFDVRTMDEIVGRTVAERRLFVVLLGLCAAAALALAVLEVLGFMRPPGRIARIP